MLTLRVVLLTIISCMFFVGCFPAIFGAATATTVHFAKDVPVKESASDYRISIALKKGFISKGFNDLYTKITTEVIDGRVMLIGNVDSYEDINKAVEIAWGVEGVKEVLNELQVSEDSKKFKPGQYAKDSWITGQIKTSLLLNRGVKFSNYTIVTQDGVVYIFGIARSSDELTTVANVAASVKGVQRVVTHATSKDYIASEHKQSEKN